jgi:ABC-type glycerol-3-phosphate transport system substrate-binding protein
MKLTIAMLAATLALAACSGGGDQPANDGAAAADTSLNAGDLGSDGNDAFGNDVVLPTGNGADLTGNAAEPAGNAL